MSWIPVAGLLVLLAGFLYEIYTGSIRGWLFFKPDLKIDVKKCEFYNDVTFNKSGINFRIYINNRGNKTTTIRGVHLTKIHPMIYMNYISNKSIYKLIKLEPTDDIPFSGSYFFENIFEEVQLKLELTIEYTEGTKSIEVVCNNKR